MEALWVKELLLSRHEINLKPRPQLCKLEISVLHFPILQPSTFPCLDQRQAPVTYLFAPRVAFRASRSTPSTSSASTLGAPQLSYHSRSSIRHDLSQPCRQMPTSPKGNRHRPRRRFRPFLRNAHLMMATAQPFPRPSTPSSIEPSTPPSLLPTMLLRQIDPNLLAPRRIHSRSARRKGAVRVVARRLIQRSQFKVHQHRFATSSIHLSPRTSILHGAQ